MEDKQHVPFDELLEDRTKEGTKLQTSEYSADGLHPIIDQGQKDIAGYTDREDGIFPVVPCIVFGDHTRVIKYVDKPFFLGADGVKVLCPKTASNNTKYLYYALNSVKIPDTGYNRHYKWLKEARITVYSKEKQDKLVSIFELIDDLISLRKKQLQKLDDLVKSRFVEMFGDPVINPKHWNVRSLQDMGDCKNGMNFHHDDSGVDIHCLGVGDFQNLSIITDVSMLSMVSLNEMPSDEYMLQDEDIVFVRSNGNEALVGRCVAVYPGTIPTTFSGFCIRYRKRDESITTQYVLRVLKTDSMRAKMAGRGANIQNLNQQILGSLNIPIPPIELQKQFADFVSYVDKSKLTVQQGLDKLELLKQSLMQKYFG